MDKEQFLAERQRGLGGSDAASVLGLSPWGSPMSVYKQKVYGPGTELDNEYVYWGRKLESVIRDVYTEKTGNAVTVPPLLVHPEYPFLIGHVDGMVVDDDGKQIGMIEIKTANISKRDDWGDPGTDQIPKHYMIQIQHYLGLTDVPWCDACVLIGGNDYRTYRILRNQKLIDAIYAKEVEFWRTHVEPQNPPEIDGSAASNDVLVRIYPRAAGERESWPEIDELARKLRDTQTAITALSDEADRLKNLIKEQMGPIAKVIGPDYSFTWAEAKGRQTIDSKRLKEEMPDVAEKYTKVGEPTRVLRPYWKKGASDE